MDAMKIFISHKQEDKFTAQQIAGVLAQEHVNFYLDTLDSTITGSGKELTEHIKNNLGTCTDILVVMSEKTKQSQWVPFEVGMATELELPTVTYLAANVSLPDFLDYWPRLRYYGDVSTYVSERRNATVHRVPIYEHFDARAERKIDIPEFYSRLKQRLKY